MKVLFASAELRPLVSAGGLGEAAAGLTAALRRRGHDVLTVLPAYERWDLEDDVEVRLDVPDWATPAVARIGHHPVAGPLALVSVPGIERPDPYVDEHGVGWADNDARFASFSAAVASLARREAPDVVHLNDWHTGLVGAFLGDETPTVLTIHNLQHQGWASIEWLHHLPRGRDQYVRGDAVNALAGAIRLADAVVAVSPTYANEITHPAHGFGLDDLLRERGPHLHGVINGIDTRMWDPAADDYAPTFDADDLDGKAAARAALLDHVGWHDTGDPLIVIVGRLVEQKGIELAVEAARFLPGVRARMIVLGSGDPELAWRLHQLAVEQHERVWFHEGYDIALSHLMFAGGDALLMPSRFEPCGLAQMQAMAYGTMPIVTPVGGLLDTVIDADGWPSSGTGIVASGVDVVSIVDALHRAVRALRHAGRRKAIQRRGMRHDWSWTGPAASFETIYDEVVGSK